MSVIIPSKPNIRKPDWATGSTAKITDPGAGKQEVGWTTDTPSSPYGEKPPFPVFNWLLNSIGQWSSYFSSAIDSLASQGRKIDYFVCTKYQVTNLFLYPQVGFYYTSAPIFASNYKFYLPYNCICEISVLTRGQVSDITTSLAWLVGDNFDPGSNLPLARGKSLVDNNNANGYASVFMSRYFLANSVFSIYFKNGNNNSIVTDNSALIIKFIQMDPP